ncbi:MAG: relaxase/mobilization nuclease domain-containing protein [Bacteroidales bacterium]
MIAKIDLVKGSNGLQLINYVLDEKKTESVFCSNMIGSLNPTDIHNEFVEVSERNKRCKNKFISLKIGIAPDDKRHLQDNPDELEKICNEYSKRLGLDAHQWFSVIHTDTDNLHLHMIINRIPVNDTNAYKTDFIGVEVSAVAEQISRDMGLVVAREQNKKTEKCYFDSEQRATARAKLEFIASQVMAGKPKSLEEFISSMNTNSVDVMMRTHKHKGSVYGLRFTLDNENFKASEIGKQCGYNRLVRTLMENANELKVQAKNVETNLSADSTQIVHRNQNFFEEIAGAVGGADEQDVKRKKKRKFKR